MIDLHTHSNASDGELEPARLVEKAALLGLGALALTDHDTLSGLDEARQAALQRHMEFIPGIELEISMERAVRGEFHLLGLGLVKPGALFLDTLEYLAGARDRRNRAILEKIRAAGIEADYEEIEAFAGGKGKPPLVGRPHFGLFLIRRRVVKNQEQAFKRWLGKGRPFYVPKEGLEFQKAARLIHEAGGAAVLAHPLSLYVSWGRLPGLVSSLKEQGLDGIEAWHPNAKTAECKRLEELGRSLGLCITAGSDFHGATRPDRKLGSTAGGRTIEDGFLPALKERQNRYRGSTVNEATELP